MASDPNDNNKLDQITGTDISNISNGLAYDNVAFGFDKLIYQNQQTNNPTSTSLSLDGDEEGC